MISRTIRPLRAVIVPRIPRASPWAPSIAIRTLTTEALTSSPAQATTAGASSIPSTTSNQQPQPPQGLPYFIGRSNLNNYSVYERRARGGTLKKTLIKKGEGNLQALKHDIATHLGMDAKMIRVNNVTNHVEIPGHCRPEVLEFLKNMGF
ncbi:mitochondrial large subunit ribosomal protein-domain-containing protein [Xylariales sp. PMI_506]|nr:mitochondrial large subunit ribosomal protein-domain-containing protein [Xylariales sp. PMI_506]